MKVKFPVLIKNRPQFITFLEFLDRNGVVWADGEKATCFLDSDSDESFSDLKFPVYIFYWDHEKHREPILLWHRCDNDRYITYTNIEDSSKWSKNYYYCNEEIEFENE